MTTTAPAITVIECVNELVEDGALGAGARITAIGALATAAQAHGLDPHAPIDSDLMDTLVVDAIPAQLWQHA